MIVCLCLYTDTIENKVFVLISDEDLFYFVRYTKYFSGDSFVIVTFHQFLPLISHKSFAYYKSFGVIGIVAIVKRIVKTFYK